MNLKKCIVIITAVINLVACANSKDKEQPVATTVIKTKKKVEARTFDVIGNTEGENDLNYQDYVETSRASAGASYTVKGKTYAPTIDIDYKETGLASWYGGSFHGRKTASGVKFDKALFTAAHKTLPIPSVVRVVNIANQRSALVVINDRGPFVKNRIIDLSKKSAEHLGMVGQGVGKVKIEYLYKETKEMLKKLPRKEREEALLAYQYALTRQMAKEVNSPKNSRS